MTLLRGVAVIEAASFVAGPSGGLYLAQMGADVVRVDPIAGGPDASRWPRAPNGASLYWENLNRGKRSVALDLRSAEGRDLLAALIKATGQFLTNHAASGLLAHAAMAGDDPVVTVRVAGTADGGPAFDYTVNAAVGIPDLTGPGPDPVNHHLPAWDLLTGAYAAFAMLAAMRARDADGRGREVVVPLADVAAGGVAMLGMVAEARHGPPRPRCGNALYGAFGRDFVTRDGVRVMVTAITERQWRALLATLDLHAAVAALEAATGADFTADEGARFVHRDALFPMVERAIAARDCATLEAAARDGLCVGRYAAVATVGDDARLFTASDAHPSGLRYPVAGAFALVDGARPCPAATSRPGADGAAVLAERLGLSDGAIARLIDKGVLGR